MIYAADNRMLTARRTPLVDGYLCRPGAAWACGEPQCAWCAGGPQWGGPAGRQPVDPAGRTLPLLVRGPGTAPAADADDFARCGGAILAAFLHPAHRGAAGDSTPAKD